MKHRNKIIMASALSLAAIAVAIDHTKHHVPDAAYGDIEIIGEESKAGGGAPCSLDAAPCSIENPCSM
jgi:hypothetical protein